MVSLFSSKSYRFTEFPSRLKSCVFPGSLGDMSHSYEREKFPGLHKTRIYDLDLLPGSSNKHINYPYRILRQIRSRILLSEYYYLCCRHFTKTISIHIIYFISHNHLINQALLTLSMEKAKGVWQRCIIRPQSDNYCQTIIVIRVQICLILKFNHYIDFQPQKQKFKDHGNDADTLVTWNCYNSQHMTRCFLPPDCAQVAPSLQSINSLFSPYHINQN